MSSNKDKLLEKIAGDAKYNAIMKSADPEVRAQVEKLISAFFDEIGSNLDMIESKMTDPEFIAEVKKGGS